VTEALHLRAISRCIIPSTRNIKYVTQIGEHAYCAHVYTVHILWKKWNWDKHRTWNLRNGALRDVNRNPVPEIFSLCIWYLSLQAAWYKTLTLHGYVSSIDVIDKSDEWITQEWLRTGGGGGGLCERWCSYYVKRGEAKQETPVIDLVL
jgi:hypothetical protein